VAEGVERVRRKASLLPAFDERSASVAVPGTQLARPAACWEHLPVLTSSRHSDLNLGME